MYEYAYAQYLYSKAFKAYNATRLHASVVFHGKSCVENVDFQGIQFNMSGKQTTELVSNILYTTNSGNDIQDTHMFHVWNIYQRCP